MKYINFIQKKWILLFFIFIFFIIFSILNIHYFNLYEGILQVNVKNNKNIQYIIIEPKSTTSYTSFLHLSDFAIYDYSGEKIEYTALSSNGIFNDDKKYDYIALTDTDTSTYFQSGNEGCTLKIIPKNTSLKIRKIFIRNRLDCCFERLRGYKISIINKNFDVFFTANFSDMENLYKSPFMEEILISNL